MNKLPVMVALEDLLHAAVTGLCKAATNYKDRSGISFSTYAKHRIRGAILDSLRQRGGASPPPPIPFDSAEGENRSAAGSSKVVALTEHTIEVSPILFTHAVQTFGSNRAAHGWFSSQCGALRNRTPLEMVRAGNAVEVERILDCIDYGMFA